MNSIEANRKSVQRVNTVKMILLTAFLIVVVASTIGVSAYTSQDVYIWDGVRDINSQGVKIYQGNNSRLYSFGGVALKWARSNDNGTTWNQLGTIQDDVGNVMSHGAGVDLYYNTTTRILYVASLRQSTQWVDFYRFRINENNNTYVFLNKVKGMFDSTSNTDGLTIHVDRKTGLIVIAHTYAIDGRTKWFASQDTSGSSWHGVMDAPRPFARFDSPKITMISKTSSSGKVVIMQVGRNLDDSPNYSEYVYLTEVDFTKTFNGAGYWGTYKLVTNEVDFPFFYNVAMTVDRDGNTVVIWIHNVTLRLHYGEYDATFATIRTGTLQDYTGNTTIGLYVALGRYNVEDIVGTVISSTTDKMDLYLRIDDVWSDEGLLINIGNKAFKSNILGLEQNDWIGGHFRVLDGSSYELWYYNLTSLASGTPSPVSSIGNINNLGQTPNTNALITWWSYNDLNYVKRITMEYNLGIGNGWQTRFDILNTEQNRTDDFELFLNAPHNSNIGLRMTMYANTGGLVDIVYHNFTAFFNESIVEAGLIGNIPAGYLFVYQEYQFKINTVGMNESIKFSFNDGNSVFNMTWDRAGENSTKTGTDILEVTRVAYTYEKYVERYNYTIYFILPQEIYDTFNRTFSYQAEGVNQSVWFSTPPVYHVYNIGGFTNYDSLGWAGRITGGSAYEIFASDTRAPIMIDLYDFDVRPNPLPASQGEEDLVNFILSDWNVHNPYRTATADMYPTNRLTSYATTSWRAYTSLPFGFRIFDDNVAVSRQLYIEKTFRRRIGVGSGEDVIAQVNMMNPDVDVFAGQFRLQQDSIFDTGAGLLVSQIRFDTASNIDMFNFSSGVWTDLLAVTDYTWYNVTVHVNFTGLTVDAYIDGVLLADDMPFADNTATSVNAVFFGTINSVTTLNDFYIDDVEIHTTLSDLLGGIVEANTIYRKLNQWSMKYGFGIEQPDGVQVQNINNGWVEQAVDLMIDGVWIEHIRYQIKPVDVEINSNNNWVKWQVDWYRANKISPSKTNYIFTLYEADDKLPSDILQRDLSSFFSDIWIGSENASSVIAGRINGEWYGISDKAPFYQFWRNDWKPKLTDVTASLFYAPIVDSNNLTAYSKDVQLVRIRATVFRNQTGTFHYKIRDIDYLERKEQFGTEPLEGVDTPSITPTKVPDMPQGLFLMPLYAVIRALGRILMNVIVSAGTAIISGIDIMLVQIGLPPILSNAVAIFMLAFEIVTPIVTMLTEVAITLVINITQIAEIMILALPKFAVLMGYLVTDFVYFWTILVDILTGQLFGINNIWLGLDVISFVQLWLFGIYPVWQVERIEKAKDPMKQLADDAQFFYGMLMGVFNMGMKFISILIDIINSLFNFLG